MRSYLIPCTLVPDYLRSRRGFRRVQQSSFFSSTLERVDNRHFGQSRRRGVADWAATSSRTAASVGIEFNKDIQQKISKPVNHPSPGPNQTVNSIKVGG